VDRISYDAWGNILAQSTANVSVLNPCSYLGQYGFDGYDYDAAAQLDLVHARVYDPVSQGWIEQDPMGFAAGDSNLYRYVNNAPKDATDPSGFQSRRELLSGKMNPRPAPVTPEEMRALRVLGDEIIRWRKNGWTAAAALLEHFVSKSDGSLYTLEGSAKDDVIAQAESMVRKAIEDRITKNDTIFNNLATLKKGQNASITFKEHVRWQSTVWENPVGAAYGTEDIKDLNNDLFYAYGGADLTVHGTIMGFRYKAVGAFPPEFTYAVKADVKIEDDYTFKPEGPLGSRLWIDAYAAANTLENKFGYKSFKDAVSYSRSYTGFGGGGWRYK
jgi:RHS repeat-associated protein